MRVVMFFHSLVSDWNHGNAHFLRGIASEMLERGHDVRVFEPRDAWSVSNLIKDHGEQSVRSFHSTYPLLSSTRYDIEKLELDRVLDGADLVIVHEWNERELIGSIGEHHSRQQNSYTLLFHDTHHRAVSDRKSMSSYDLSGYDGVLAFGNVIRDIYIREGWASRAWTWHEAADTRVFYPRSRRADLPIFDIVWIGNWGDEERTAELHELFIKPVKDLGLRALVHGVRYPEKAIAELKRNGIEYGGWLPNFDVPQVFAQATMTVHLPRRPYVEKLPGIPTIRPFEALACGIPLISASWTDSEHLFTPGKDFLVVRDGEEMRAAMKMLLTDESARRSLAKHGLETIRGRHTCTHRVDELLQIYTKLQASKDKTLERSFAVV